MSVPAAQFGPGILICTRTDIANGTPINVGYANEFSIDYSGTTKQLFGQNQLPLVAARGTIKVTGKIKAAVLSGIAMNSLFWGQTLSTAAGGLAWTVGSTFSLSTTTLNTSTGTPLQVGSSLTFDADLGVTFVNTGLPGRRVSTGLETSSGLYSVVSTSTGAGAGQYYFSSADTISLTAGTTNPIKVNFTSTTTTGQSLIVANQLIGYSPTFQLDYYTNLNQPTGKPFVVRCYQAIADKAVMAWKLEDFMMPEYDFSLFANASGNLVDQVWPEIS
jgi:hypothetical protein